jgi:uncharacterized protein YutE (UPF0331/DUF86 family)
MSEMDVVLSKINIIKNCLYAIEKATAKESDLHFKQHIYELNLQRAIQACIDLANVVISKEGLGLPNTYKAAFEILQKHAVIEDVLCSQMCSMVGFRNISVHDYSEVKPEIVNSIVNKHLPDFEKFYSVVYNRAKNWG